MNEQISKFPPIRLLFISDNTPHMKPNLLNCCSCKSERKISLCLHEHPWLASVVGAMIDGGRMYATAQSLKALPILGKGNVFHLHHSRANGRLYWAKKRNLIFNTKKVIFFILIIKWTSAQHSFIRSWNISDVNSNRFFLVPTESF